VLFDATTGSELASISAGGGDQDTGFCTFAHWTPDGSSVIVSHGPGI
jgi:hypothetical protein